MVDGPPKTHLSDLEDAVYYHNDVYGSRILARIFGDYLGGRVLEVGAGAGYITSELAQRCDTVDALEPNAVLFAELRKKTHGSTHVAVKHCTLEEFIKESKDGATTPTGGYDAIVYINVLEHIGEDVRELSLARALLATSGRVLIVVPAHQHLYSRVDRLTGHHRRYSKKVLHRVITESGLTPVSIRYFDTIGYLPYLILYRVLRSTATDGANATVYSRIIMPLSYLLFRLGRGLLLGKNLVAVAQLPR